MDIIHAVILGIVEGFTEFLPISSTAHLILTSKLLGLETTEFLKTFEISIQLGAISSVVFLYRKTIFSAWELNKKIAAAFIPTAVIGLMFYKIIKNIFLENHLVSIYALLFGGIALIIFELVHKEKDSDIPDLGGISYKQALLIGLFQSVSIIPGVSRAAATIIGGLLAGVRRTAIVEFSFLLAIPTMAAATGLDIIRSADNFSKAELLNLMTGFAVSFVMAMLGIKFLMKFVKGHKFTSFGVYRIILALAFLFLF